MLVQSERPSARTSARRHGDKHLRQPEIVCVCTADGFPLGSATAAKITTLGKALLAAGFEFRLLHCGPSPTPANTQKCGTHEGIRFEYTTSVRRPRNRLALLVTKVRAVAVLILRLAQFKLSGRDGAVYLYVLYGWLLLICGLVCRALRIPVVQDVCEWVPAEAGCSRLTHWLYSGQMFRYAAGAVVISSGIEAKVRRLNPDLALYRLPAVVDTTRIPAAPVRRRIAEPAEFVWCGTVDGWLRDVRFMIKAIACVKRRGYECTLKIIGAYSESAHRTLTAFAVSQGLSGRDLVFTGCVEESVLHASYQSAAALLLPLPNEERSATRLPNKLGEYLMAARPVITGRIGDLTEFLFDNYNALIAEPGNLADFVERMVAVLRDPDRAAEVGAAGRQAGLAQLDYRMHVQGLARFFQACINGRTA